MSTATLLLLLFSLLFFAELDVPLVDVLLVVVIVVVVFFFIIIIIILFSTINCQHEKQSHALGALSRSVHAVRKKEEQQECEGFCVPSGALRKPPTMRRKNELMPEGELDEPAA